MSQILRMKLFKKALFNGGRISFFTDNEAMALKKYEASIKAAQSHLKVHKEGLACKKAACYHLHKGRENAALLHLSQTKKCCELWGAQSLVKCIKNEILLLTPLN